MFGPISSLYEEKINAGELQEDFSQRTLADSFDELYLNLHQPSWKKLLSPHIKGMYISGDVGRGKTYLMDMFFDAVHTPKQRLHFLKFKQHLFQQLSQSKNQKWLKLAQHFVNQGELLCLDEFQIEDVGDLRILEAFFRPFFKLGGVLVTTSNYIPENFQHTHGVSKESFIQFLHEYLEFFTLKPGPDYRLKGTETCHRFHVATPLRKAVKLIKTIQNNKQDACTHSFNSLCESSVGTQYYEEIIQNCKKITITNVPQLDDTHSDSLLRFMQLVDLVYEHKRLLFVYADVHLQQLYIGKKYAGMFQRTLSRLLDLTSH